MLADYCSPTRQTSYFLLPLVAAILCMTIPFAFGATIYVDDSNTGTENGSAGNPYNTISEGVNVANAGDTVSVADGTYIEQVYLFQRSDLTISGSGYNTVVSNATLHKFYTLQSQGIVTFEASRSIVRCLSNMDKRASLRALIIRNICSGCSDRAF